MEWVDCQLRTTKHPHPHITPPTPRTTSLHPLSLTIKTRRGAAMKSMILGFSGLACEGGYTMWNSRVKKVEFKGLLGFFRVLGP